MSESCCKVTNNLDSYECVSCDSRTKLSLELDLLYTQSYILQKLVHTIPVLVPPNLTPCTLVNTTAAAVSSSYISRMAEASLRGQPSITVSSPSWLSRHSVQIRQHWWLNGHVNQSTHTYSNRVTRTQKRKLCGQPTARSCITICTYKIKWWDRVYLCWWEWCMLVRDFLVPGKWSG